MSDLSDIAPDAKSESVGVSDTVASYPVTSSPIVDHETGNMSDKDLIERVARAIGQQIEGPCEDMDDPWYGKPLWQAYIVEAQAALSAIDLPAQREAAARAALDARFFIDCEFDGHNGPLLSIAVVKNDGRGIHIATTAEASDPWVLANVVPLIDQHNCRMAVRCLPDEVGAVIKTFINCDEPTIIADSPVDIARFCRALSTGTNGQWASADYPMMRFEVHNIDCYPTTLPNAVQHNAWWDAMALREAIRTIDPAAFRGGNDAMATD